MDEGFHNVLSEISLGNGVLINCVHYDYFTRCLKTILCAVSQSV